jgi:hypothetical protein
MNGRTHDVTRLPTGRYATNCQTCSPDFKRVPKRTSSLKEMRVTAPSLLKHAPPVCHFSHECRLIIF